ncbi:MAG: mechanosensitive ion channel family protein [Mangrovibacterium sp.]
MYFTHQMIRMIEMKNLEIFRLGDASYSLWQIILFFVILAVAIIVNQLSIRLLNRYSKRNQVPDRFSRFLRQGIRAITWFITLILLLEVLQINYQTILQHPLYSTEKFTVKVANLFIIFVIIYFIRIFAFVSEYMLDLRIERKKMDRGRGKSFIQIIKYLIWMVGLTIIISSLGFRMTLVIASVSALLVGVGFGLQHIFNDFFSGIIILFDGSIEVDDVVEVEGVVGRVLEIGLRVSKVLTRDNVVIIVPNSRFTGEKIINWTHNDDATRFHVNVGVAYGSDVRLVERILLAAADGHKQIARAPKPFVRFNDFGESSLDFQLYFWTVNDFLVENIKSDLRFVVDDEFRKNKVEIPFPQRDLHLKTKHFER